MKAYRYAIIAALVAISAVPALAQRGGKDVVSQFLRPKSQLKFASGVRIRPISIAGLSNGQVVTPYYPIIEDNDWPNGPWSTIFDSIELSPADNTTTPPFPDGRPYENPAYGPAYWVPPNYGLTAPAPGNRWYGGPDWESTFITNDFDVSPLFAGFEADRVAYMWRWAPTNPTETMIINVFLSETFASTAAGLPPPPMGGPNNVSFSGFIDGVSLNYGNNMGAGIPAGNYFDNVDLTTPPPPIKLGLPVDGRGAYSLQMLSSTSPPTLASRGQFFLWICKQANAALPGGNHSNSGINQWDDDTDVTSTSGMGGFINNSDGRHFTDPPGPAHLVEFYDYTAATTLPPGPITEPIQATFGLYSQYGAFTAAQDTDISITAGLAFGPVVASALRVQGSGAISVLNDNDDSIGQIVVRVPTPGTTTTAISFINRTRATRTDLSEFIEVFDNPNNNWFLLNFRTTTIFYENIRVDLDTNAANYLAPNGDVRLRYTWIPNQELLSGDGWTQSLDRLTVFVKGVQSN